MKKNRINLIATLATAVFSLSSCIYDDEVSTYAPNGGFSDEEINISTSMFSAEAVETRAASNLQGDNLDDWTTAGIFVYRTGKTAADNTAPSYAGYTNVAVTAPTGATTTPSATNKLTLTPATKLYFPVDKTDVDVYVYAPFATHSDITSMAFTIDADQSTDAKYKASDFVYGMGTAHYSGTPAKTAEVTMNHALTKLTFFIEDVGGIAGNIEEISLGDVYKKATIDMSKAISAGAVTTSTASGDKGTVKVSNSTDNTSLYANVNKTASASAPGVSAIIPPQSGMSASSGATVSVKINSVTKTAYLGSASLTSFDPGKEYKYTLKILSDEVIVVVVSIVDWVAGAAQERELTF